MSLAPKGADTSEGGLNQKTRKSDRLRESYQKHTIENLIRQAEYKDSLGMELTLDERFVLDNKSFLLRRSKDMKGEK